MINYNENEGENDSLHRYDIIELDQDSIYNLFHYDDGYVQQATPKQSLKLNS